MKYQRKRTIFIIIIMILLLLLTPALPALGEDEIGINVSNTSLAPDGQAAVTVALSNCRGMDSLQVDIWYDANAVMLTDAAPGDLLAGGIYAFNTETAGVIRFAYASAEGLREGNGTALMLTFAALQDTGSAVLVSEAKASRFDGENGTGQLKAFVMVENGGIAPADSKVVPEAGVTPWIPETPTPTPEPTPESTGTPQIQATPVLSEESPKQTDPIMRLAYLAGGAAVIAFAAAAVLLLSGRRRRD